MWNKELSALWLVLAFVIVIALGILFNQGELRWREHVAAKQDAAKATTFKMNHDARKVEWLAMRDQIVGRIKGHIDRLEFVAARDVLQPYLVIANAETSELNRVVQVGLLSAELPQLPRGDLEGRLAMLRRLSGMEPKNERWKTQMAEIQRALAAARKAQVAAELARRRKEGVTIGMTQREVLLSNWGRPRLVNRTTTALGTREQWVYGGGYLYFDNGVLTTIQN